MSALTPEEICREGRRILRLIAAPDARLSPRKDGGWAVVRRGDPASRRTRIKAELAEAFRSRGWLTDTPDGSLALAQTGRAWLAAELAGTDAYAAHHLRLGTRTVIEQTGGAAVVAVNEAESPLAWLKARHAIGDVQFEAGEKLRRDYTIARLEPRLTIDLAAPKVDGRGAADAALIPDTVLAAKQRFARALKAVGPGLSDLLFDVCCALKGVSDIETEKNWPRRSAKIVLGLALDRLADHYGLNRPPVRASLRSWSAEHAEAPSG